MTRFTVVIFILAMAAANVFARAEPQWSAEEKRAFVEKCLPDTNVFIYNLPTNMHRHLNQTPWQTGNGWQYASTNGTVLFLYPDGSLWAYWSNRAGKETGPAMSWHRNGQLAADETYDQGKVTSGHYYDDSGKSAGEIVNGSGRRLSLEVRNNSVPSEMDYLIADYHDGLEDGVETHYQDHARVAEIHFKKGKRNGLAIYWDKGKKRSEVNYIDGKRNGPETYWYPTGQKSAINHFRDGSLESSEVFRTNGIRFKEIIHGADALVTEKFFYDNGALMVEQSQRLEGIINAKSFDSTGHLNGEVKAGNGRIVAAYERLPHWEMYQGGKMTKNLRLPFIKLAPGAEIYGKVTDDSTYHLSIVTEDAMKTFKVDVRLPKGVTSDKKLSFTATNTIAGLGAVFGPFELKFSAAHHQWTEGDTVAEVEVELDDGKVNYQMVVLHEKLF
jgi:antitoxin component YwqK of YwqJK toxin-antitoxin module